MKKLVMGALLGVAQGSATEPQLLVMRWDGAGAKGGAPAAFVGKGVTFDTGGISIKPAAGMEDMKWDMGGAAAVVGAMKALAGRKANAHAVGVCGLVENMPGGNAQRPGDVVTSMRSEEHTSELQSLMRTSYAVYCLKKKKQQQTHHLNPTKLTYPHSYV